ncbi:hypothetical protein BKA62DRAFT_677657 [Auriculariales sp. MPI-PUGE-AT-0066]|nr:hypothetical protein BKA62DRAFT_677657 [Auriculariales sp. MPI-PUGE-AT-0066]
MSNLQNQLWPPLENALAQSQPLPLLPIELICEVVRLASCESLDVSLEWTTNLALLSQSLLSTVRAVIYELFVVGQRVQDEDLNDQSRVHADPSVREFLIMMTDSSDHRRQCVRCLVFFRRPEELALEGWNGPGWSIDTIVSAISGEGVNNEGEPIPSIPIQTRRFASYVHYAHTNAKGCGEHYAHLRFDVNLATVGTITLTPGHDTYVHFSARDDDKLDKHTVSILYTAVSGADVVMIFSPGATVLALGDVKVTEEHKRIFSVVHAGLDSEHVGTP